MATRRDPLADLDRRIRVSGARLLAILSEARNRNDARIAALARKRAPHQRRTVIEWIGNDLNPAFALLERSVVEWAREVVDDAGRSWWTMAAMDRGVRFADVQTPTAYSRGRALMFFEYDVKPSIAAQTNRMRAQEISAIRRAFEDVAQLGQVQGLAGNQRMRLARDRFLAEAGTDRDAWRFIDRAGKKWSTGSYWSMLTRTVNATTARQAYHDELAQAGEDLVRIVNAGDPCSKCDPWGGRIVSVSGADGRFPSLADARKAGVFHPNCVCHTRFVSTSGDVAMIDAQSDIGPPEDAWSPTPPKRKRADATGV